MLASRAAYTEWRAPLLAEQERVGFKPFKSATLKGGQPAQPIAVAVAGLRELWLVVDGAPDPGSGHGVWGEPVLISAEGSRLPLGQMNPVHVSVGWHRLLHDKDHKNKPLQVADKTFEHGLFAHARSELCYELGGRFARFEAWIGLNRTASRSARVVFEVNAHCPYSPSGLWRRIERDFPCESGRLARDARGKHLAWFGASTQTELEREWIGRLGRELGKAGAPLLARLEALTGADTPAGDRRWLALWDEASQQRMDFRRAARRLARVNPAAMRRAVDDLAQTFAERYADAPQFLQRLARLEERLPAIRDALERGEPESVAQVSPILALQREILLANPLLDFERLLLVKRSARSPGLGLPQNWQGNCALPRRGFDNEIAVLARFDAEAAFATLYRPERDVFVGDVDLHFDADRLLFSSIGAHNRWQIFEIGVDGKGLRQVTTGEDRDVDSYDACYLPGGRIIFGSTACFQGVPCVGGGNQVANLYTMAADGSNVRRLCFDQDHDWCPAVMNDGRVLFTRWEYSDTAHYFTRLLMRMNPDGTGQLAYYGSNSYWPNSLFYARAVPGHASKVVGVVSGHHGVARMGDLVILDPARGQQEADGVVQRIPGYGKTVEPVIRDRLVDKSWPKFLHPYPLSEKVFLVSGRPSPADLWGIYLVDVFDNMLLLREEPGYALLEPMPLRKMPKPPEIPDRVQLTQKQATVYLSDVYLGPGLLGIPRETVKALRLFAFDYGYQGLANHTYIGMDGPWDVHRILGTVPVEPDGSAAFHVPANTPIAVQPLDAEGRALQVMRSWFTAMPGENVSCVGCHERLSDAPPVRLTRAMQRAPSDIRPWYGPARGFSFKREVQPVLDRSCVRCHNGATRPNGSPMPDLRPGREGSFTRAYRALHPYVRRPCPESDYHLLPPAEYHADTSELIQMLRKGHHGVRPDREAFDRFVTWIDLNVPDHGTWGEFRQIPGSQHRRRLESRARYEGIGSDYEFVPPAESPAQPQVEPAPAAASAPARNAAAIELDGWPFAPDEAARCQAAAGPAVVQEIELGSDADGTPVMLDLVLVPAGRFVMGSTCGFPDETPPHPVRIERPFWLGRCEVSNRQFARFDPAHDSRYFNVGGKDQSKRGIPMNQDEQPVVRISWQRAMAFCRWLAARTGRPFTLPTEAQWEWACRAGSASAFAYGQPDADFAAHANVADRRMARLKGTLGAGPWRLGDNRFDDGALVTAEIGRYRPNAWGLRDMHGNAAEWTLSLFRAYPYQADDGRNDGAGAGARIVRGGSFHDRPPRCRSAFRLGYPAWQGVFNVGFRVCCEAAAEDR
ncbi:MAG: SUMF1/EgtB/PvdO family nonheme iron enzyme [Kiritimatiellae bacterium]|nr:SUMF1/EgtB/PvdO family nonheme iron enzyme [Kiritimatiellia bacterium]